MRGRRTKGARRAMRGRRTKGARRDVLCDPRAVLACIAVAAAILASVMEAEAAFEWRHAPPVSAAPLAECAIAGALAIFVSPVVAMGPPSAAISGAQPYALDGLQAGAVATVSGSRIGWGCGVGWLRHDQYREHQAIVAMSFAAGAARLGVDARVLEVSVDGYNSARAVSHDAGLLLEPAAWASLTVAAGGFVSAGDRALRRSLAPEVSAAASVIVRPEIRLLVEARQPAGYAAESACGVSWTPARGVRWGLAVTADPPAMRTALALTARGITFGAAYHERPPLPPSVSASLEVRR